jgi:hypothetical protein
MAKASAWPRFDAWLAPDHRSFKVRGDNGTCYAVRNNMMTARWELTMFDSNAPSADGRREVGNLRTGKRTSGVECRLLGDNTCFFAAKRRLCSTYGRTLSLPKSLLPRSNRLRNRLHWPFPTSPITSGSCMLASTGDAPWYVKSRRGTARRARGLARMGSHATGPNFWGCPRVGSTSSRGLPRPSESWGIVRSTTPSGRSCLVASF